MKYTTLFSIALAGFTALSEAQPHRFKARHPHVVPRGIVTVIATHTVDQYGNLVAAPTATAGAHSPIVEAPATEPDSSDSESSEPSDSETSGPSDTESTDSEDDEPAEYTFVAPSEPSATAVPDDDLEEAPISVKPVSGIDSEFPDGKLSCDQFPSDYGALAVNWVTKQGWSGIQFDERQSSGEIRLANADGRGECQEGYYCSYACPPGYSKTQWPENQPANGESIGGLLCKNGKLRLTRPNASKKLCIAGADNTSVVNRLNKEVAICRTDYPGSEKMSVPIVAKPGSTERLTVPHATASYVWNGKPTTAQYYVNNAGVPVEEGCVWGEPDGGKGNWAPLVFGAGVNDNGETYLSVFQNPLNSEKANYNVKISTGNPRQDCKFENGKFYGPGTENGSGSGCTSFVTGKAQYIFY